MVDIICALCGKKQLVKTVYKATFDEKSFSKNVYSARRLPDKIHYKILKCERCGLVFSSPILPTEKLSRLYRESICSYDDQVPYLTKTYLNLVLPLKKKLPKNPKVLEVGCAEGFFLKSLIDVKFTSNVFGVEPSSKMVLKADGSFRKNIKVDIFREKLFPPKSFDLICCFHTLDHMFDPNEFIRGAFSMLKKNGYAIAVVHDTEGLSVRLFGEKSAIFDIEHIYLFNKKTLKNIFLNNGFKVIKVSDLVNNYPLKYWAKMSGFPDIVKKGLNFIFEILSVNNKAISIAAGNISIIAKKT